MSDPQLLSPGAVAEQLHISTDQLRRWTKDFAAQLSASAVGAGQYRYTADDVKRLQTISDLLAQGKSIEEVSHHLSSPSASDTLSSSDVHTSDNHQPETILPSESPAPADSAASVVIHPEDTSAQGPAAMVLSELLQGFAAGQEAILNSQQANRNLMGVVIQDNFNLKEENARLRERMVKLEQELNEIRRAQAEYRQQVEQRLRQMEPKRDWRSRLLGF